MSAQPLVPDPAVPTLAGEVALLREELTKLFAETHDLWHLVKPHLLALYQTKVGVWELQLLQAQCDGARLKRKVELVQASLNQGRAPDLPAVEERLEREFLTWQTKLAEAAARMQQAEWRLTHLLAPADDRELKKLYRELVKRLHPDVNPHLSADVMRLWLRAQASYEAGDLAGLKALLLLAEKQGGESAHPPPFAKAELERQRETLEGQIAAALREIERIEGQPPFILRANLEDDDWVTARRAELETQTEAARAQAAALQTHLNALLPTASHGPVFGHN